MGNGPIRVNMEKAREVQRDRSERSGGADGRTQDAAWFRAQDVRETRTAIAAAVAHKQALRDAPEDSSIGSATTPAELQIVTLDTILA